MLNFSARLTEHFTTSKSARPGDRELFFSRPKLNVSRLRQPGAVRAQPCLTGIEENLNSSLSFGQAAHTFCFPGPLLAHLRGCTHLVFGDQCLSTNTNWCCIHTLSTRYATVCIVIPFLPVRCHFET